MTFKLNTALAMDSIADEEDVRALKSSLNRLGYYMPYEKTGITDMPDTHMFDALKKFQSDHGLKADGIIRPNDQSFLAIATALTADTKDRFYIWRTVRDNHVRSQHATREGKVFSWNKAPKGGHPGEDYNCRCWAEPASQEQYWQMVDPPIEPVYPETFLISAYKAKPILNIFTRLSSEIGHNFYRNNIRMDDTNTWPEPPISGKLKEGLPSRQKPRLRGEKSLYDEHGGEWRYAKEDEYHNPHWDYKSSKSSSWKNVSINGKPPQKIGK